MGTVPSVSSNRWVPVAQAPPPPCGELLSLNGLSVEWEGARLTPWPQHSIGGVSKLLRGGWEKSRATRGWIEQPALGGPPDVIFHAPGPGRFPDPDRSWSLAERGR